MNASILIVDDEKEIADLIEVCLKNDGYRVYKYYDGAGGLTCIENQTIDLALLDVMLPDTDGFTILQKIRENYADSQSRGYGQDHGADAGRRRLHHKALQSS